MTTVSIIVLFIGIAITILAILATLVGVGGPKWSQRWGNILMVLSLLALLIKLDAPESSVWVPLLETGSIVLSLLGGFWAGFGDVVCTAIRAKVSWKASLKEAIND